MEVRKKKKNSNKNKLKVTDDMIGKTIQNRIDVILRIKVSITFFELRA